MTTQIQQTWEAGYYPGAGGEYVHRNSRNSALVCGHQHETREAAVTCLQWMMREHPLTHGYLTPIVMEYQPGRRKIVGSGAYGARCREAGHHHT